MKIKTFIKKRINVLLNKGSKYLCPFCGYSSNSFYPKGLDNNVIREKHIVGAGRREVGRQHRAQGRGDLSGASRRAEKHVVSIDPHTSSPLFSSTSTHLSLTLFSRSLSPSLVCWVCALGSPWTRRHPGRCGGPR